MVEYHHSRRAALEAHKEALKATGAMYSQVNRALNWLLPTPKIQALIAERQAAGLPTNELEDELRIRAARAEATQS